MNSPLDNTMFDTMTVPNHKKSERDARALQASVVLVTLRLHIARPFQIVVSAYRSVNVTTSKLDIQRTALRL